MPGFFICATFICKENMKRLTVIAMLAAAALLSACGKKTNPADQAAQDIKAMGEQRDKAQDAVKELEESQQKAREAIDKASGDESAKN